jgi:hypothetical protein
LDYQSGITVADFCVIRLSTSGQITIFTESKSGIVFDVTGFIY